MRDRNAIFDDDEDEDEIPGFLNDVEYRELEIRYRKAVVKVFCSKRRGGSGWTGFVVIANPCIILTVSHPVDKFNNIIEVENLFRVKSFGDDANYKAIAIKMIAGCDLLVLYVEKPPVVPSFSLAEPTEPIQSSTSIFSISHPDQKDWTTHRGTVCRDPFAVGPNFYETYFDNMMVFDHNAPLYPGSSGAPILNLEGEVMGMQLTLVTKRLHAVCVKDSERNADCIYEPVTIENLNRLHLEVKEISLLRCDLRQALTVGFMASSLRVMFSEEKSGDFTSNINDFLKMSVNRYLTTQGFQSPGQGKQSTEEPPRGSSSRKRQREATMLQLMVDVGAAANCAFTRGSQSDDDKSNTTAFFDELCVCNESKRVSGLPKSEMDIFDPVKAIGDELRLFHVELEADKKTEAELHNQLDAIVCKAMATC